MSPKDHMVDPHAYLADLACRLPDDMQDDGDKLDDIADNTVRWMKLDEDNPQSYPGPDDTVLGLIPWGRGDSHRYGSMLSRDSRTAVFYQAVYGRYSWLYENGKQSELVFFLDHEEEDEDDSDTYVSPPRWWARIKVPQELDLE